MRVGVTLGGTFDSLRTPWLECSVLFFFGLGDIASESHRFLLGLSCIVQLCLFPSLTST